MKRLGNKPFVLLGINSDKDREELKNVLKSERITWRSWFDGGGTHGPIATQWNVQAWPTIYVLDANGEVVGERRADPLPVLDGTGGVTHGLLAPARTSIAPGGGPPRPSHCSLQVGGGGGCGQPSTQAITLASKSSHV